jgi:hypothetical protein
MTEQTEEQEKIRKDQIANSKKSLEDIVYQTVRGANSLRTDPFKYGQLGLNAGENAYEKFDQNEKIRKLKDEIYNERLSQGKSLGVYGEPIYPTNYDVSVKIAQQVEQHKTLIPLKDLEEIVKKLGFGFDFSVPEQFKEIAPIQIIQKTAAGAALNEYEKDALAIYQMLSEAYDRSVALKIGKEGYFSDLNAMGKQISNKYAPKKEAEAGK